MLFAEFVMSFEHLIILFGTIESPLAMIWEAPQYTENQQGLCQLFREVDSTFEASGYTATIGDSRTLQTFEGVGVNTSDAADLNTTSTIGTNVSRTVIGTTINLTATTVNTLFGSNKVLQATLTVVGRDSGARLQIPVELRKSAGMQ